MRSDKTPLQLLDEFLLSDSRLESSLHDRALVIMLKIVVVLTMLAVIIAVFGIGSWFVSWLYVSGIEFVFNHWGVVALGFVALCLWGAIASRRRRQLQEGTVTTMNIQTVRCQCRGEFCTHHGIGEACPNPAIPPISAAMGDPDEEYEVEEAPNTERGFCETCWQNHPHQER